MRRIITAVVITASLAFAAAASAYPYPAVFRVNFVSQCIHNNGPYRSCECAASYVERHIQPWRLNRELAAYQNGGPVPPIMRQAARACGLAVL